MKTSLRAFGFCTLIQIFSQSSFGQTKAEFEKIFLQETEPNSSTSQTGKFKNIAKLSYYPDTLPNWFYNPPPASNDDCYSIGVSDPDLTVEEAALQAIFRAKLMAVLFNKSKFQYFKDIYTSEKTEGNYQNYRQRYDIYFKISASDYVSNECFSVVNQHITRYNEAIVLIRYQPSAVAEVPASNRALFSTVGTVLYIEVQVEDAFEPQAEYELISAIKSPNDQMLTSQFKYITKGNQFLSKSEFLGKEIDFPYYYYKYANPSWPENTEPFVTYTGLWSTLTQRLMKQLTQNIENSSVKIKSVGQQYNPQIANLTREVAIKNAKIHFNGIEFGGNDIDFKIDIQDL